MSDTATGTFQMTSFDEHPYDEFDDGRKLTKATIKQAFHGEITGEGVSENVMCYRPDGTADYVGYQRVIGSVDGREGTFVLQSVGSFDGEVARATVAVVDGSGTGDLASLRGTGTWAAPLGPEGELTLDYELG